MPLREYAELVLTTEQDLRMFLYNIRFEIHELLEDNVRLSSQRDALLDHASIIAEAGRRGASEASDIADIDLSFEAVKIALK